MCHILPGIRASFSGVLLTVLFVNSAVAQSPEPINAEEARMELIRQVPISTEVTGKLRSVNPSEEGQYVKKGDLMIEVEDKLIRKEVAEAKKKADSVVEIEFAEVALAKAEIDLKIRSETRSNAVFSDNEMRQTELEVEKSRASLAKSREDKEVLGLTLETKSAQLAQYQGLCSVRWISDKGASLAGTKCSPRRPCPDRHRYVRTSSSPEDRLQASQRSLRG